jgi:hypothetical protein
MSVDEGASPDHTHKFAKGIKIPGRPGQPFTASYTIMSQGGLVVNSTFTQTKANAELSHVLTQHRQVRINAGHEELLRVESDGGPDRGLWTQTFPELRNNVVKYNPPITAGLPTAMIANDDYQTFTDVTAATNWIQAFVTSIDYSNELVVAFDLEWDSNLCRQGVCNVPTRLLGLSIQVLKNDETRNVVFDLYKCEWVELETNCQKHLSIF